MSDQASKIGARFKLVVLVAMFLLPTVAAWYLVFFTNYGRDDRGVEHGVLINPPRQLTDVLLLPSAEHLPQGDTLYGQWSMLFFLPGMCDASCERSLYRSRQIRLAVGKHIARVQRIAVTDEDKSGFWSQYLANNYPGQFYLPVGDLREDFLLAFDDQDVGEQGAMFLVDPRGFLMMRYPSDADPTGIIRDLSRLLRLSDY